MQAKRTDADGQKQQALIEQERTADGIEIITLARPERRNALSLALMRELLAALRRIGADRTARVVIVRALGPAFSAGHALREMLHREVADYRETFDVCTVLMTEIQAIP